MFNSLNNHSETSNPIRDIALVTVATIIVSALIFSITAASMTPPQPDHFSAGSSIAADGQAEQLHNTGLALLTLGLAALPLMICSLTLGHSEKPASQQS